ncbi:MAG: DUF2249 domain-containing protein [Actinomycetota bacterium]|nr:DUF2249 domain-containing protein [Actinomycetota bacterium]
MFGKAGKGRRQGGAPDGTIHEPASERATGRGSRSDEPVPGTFLQGGPAVGAQPGGAGSHPLILDVRPLIEAGQEPFDTIMLAVSQLRDEQPLVVKAPFEPVPLEGVLSGQGFSYDAQALDGGDWEVRFTRTAQRPADPPG